MAIINQMFPAETPEDWRSVFQVSHKKPEPFNIINMTQEKFLKFTEFLKPSFLVVFPFKTHSLREVEISKANSNLIMYRENWSGIFSYMRVTSHRSRSCSGSIRGRRLTQSKHVFEVPDKPIQAYIALLLLSCEKFKDLLKLKNL